MKSTFIKLHFRAAACLSLILLLVCLCLALPSCTKASSDESTTANTESVEPIQTDTDFTDTDSAETNLAETNSAETNPAETNPAETNPADTDPAETTPPTEETTMSNNITLNAYLIPMTSKEERNEMMQLCKDADIDIMSNFYTNNKAWDVSELTYEWFVEAMADADKYGLKLLTREDDIFNVLNLSDDEIRAFAEKYKDLPGFGGFFVVDEPRNPSPYARVENILREVCPDAYINVNFFPLMVYSGEDEYLRQLCDYGGLLKYGGKLSLDTYNFPTNGGVDEKPLFANYETLRKAGLITNTDTAVYVQSVGSTQFGYRRPSGSDLRYNMMAALAYGVKEIKFFTWGTPYRFDGNYTEAIIGRDGKPTDLYYEVCKINKKIHALGTYLAACDATVVYHSINKTNNAYEIIPEELFVQAGQDNNVIISLMEERNGRGEYVFVVNKDIINEQTVTLTFDNVSTVWMVNETTGELEEKPLNDGSLTLTMAAGDCVLIKLPEGDFIKEKSEENQNLALHAPVKGTSSLGTDGYYLYNLTDGIVDSAAGTRVIAPVGEDQLLTVDLGDVKTINRIDLYPSGKGVTCGVFNPAKFSILVSADGEAWSEVVSNTETLSREYVSVFRFEDIDARYVRISIAGIEGVSNFADIGEMMVYNDDGSIEDEIKTSYIEETIIAGQNIALNKPVVGYSSTTDEPSWNCHHSYITDGNYKKVWASQLFIHNSPDAVEWITIDLLDVYDINCVKLVSQGMANSGNGVTGVNGFPENYEIQVSADGKEFVTVKAVTGDNIPPSVDDRVFTFDAVSARYVRLYATKLTGSTGGGYGIEIAEMEVFA